MIIGLKLCRNIKAAGSQWFHPPNRGSLHHLQSCLLSEGSLILKPKTIVQEYRPSLFNKTTTKQKKLGSGYV
ncbi:hypothetical protein HanIR_Chr10g0480461 [Helianthus annuus]|nr:hypothetical protein HanIR_Chr10g0480461 [Helianthus annuus]